MFLADQRFRCVRFESNGLIFPGLDGCLYRSGGSGLHCVSAATLFCILSHCVRRATGSSPKVHGFVSHCSRPGTRVFHFHRQLSGFAGGLPVSGQSLGGSKTVPAKSPNPTGSACYFPTRLARVVCLPACLIQVSLIATACRGANPSLHFCLSLCQWIGGKDRKVMGFHKSRIQVAQLVILMVWLFH